MGAFYLVRRPCGDDPEASPAKPPGYFASRGYGAPEVVSTAAMDLFVYRKICGGSSNLYQAGPGRFCAATGTLIYRRNTGESALRLILDDFQIDRVDHTELFGHFALIIGDGSKITLLTDALGVYPVWRDTEARIFSNCFLATLESLNKRRIDTQSVYEYVFQGGTYGNSSVVKDVVRVDANKVLQFDEGGLRTTARDDPLRPAESPVSTRPDHLEKNLENLQRYFSAIAACYGDHIDTALSGGYDSRLILALLLEQGILPRLHVYGAPGDPDVLVAKHIAEAESLPLDHIDKSGQPVLSLGAFAAQIGANFLALDGTPADGIFENGTDLASRIDGCGDGRLMLNGGGGEIFRNFFYLPTLRYSVRQLIWTFYSQYDPAATTIQFDEKAYQSALGRKLMRAVGADSPILERKMVEAVYPGFRCRYWMGRNNGINNTLGPALTPFIDANIVRAALQVPLSDKNFGCFEARLIRSLNPALAAHNSVYGHDFADDPPISRRFKDLLALARPTWLRRYTFRIKHRRPEPRPYWLSERYLETAIDVAFPVMSRLFNIPRVNEVGQFNRLATLEYLFGRYPASDLPDESVS